MILLTMFVLGLLLGFGGGGGAGFVLALLVTVFHIPVHTALGTSITAMIFTVLSGAISHYREGNAVLKFGASTGLFGAIGAYLATFAARIMPEHVILWIAASMLFLCSFLIWLRTQPKMAELTNKFTVDVTKKSHFWLASAGVGLITGGLSGLCGIGAAPMIQFGLLAVLGLPLRQAVGTTSVVILPIAVFGAIGYLQAGFLDWLLLLQILVGTMTGSFIGAKFTKRAPVLILRSVVIGMPLVAGFLMLV
ncbi:sulfite exporter TauE/SafE family protein [Effusibacillus dendaii]|uniref:Probable membrane transporter protein n=1 Tax=Effusibacillus dendaii TaxID=2743772 RepID=A0A7I8D4J9_9BACL|nr:sulfite exporter TauE/SafE family protein [Effusibacillus dendaii]BCJ85043.1 UPF0721 transmembrane protein [Effusibacillus dendaii]